MYTILVTDENELQITVEERIMQRSKLVDTLHFLVDPIYKELDMSDFTVLLEYILPISRELHTEALSLSPDLYKDHLEYRLPFDTALTKEHGNVEMQLTFVKVALDAQGNNTQYVRKTSPTSVTIVPISAWSDIVADKALGAIDAALLQLDGKIKALEEMAETYHNTKADSMKLDVETHELYLTANGQEIGDKIHLSDLGDLVAEASEDGLITVVL